MVRVLNIKDANKWVLFALAFVPSIVAVLGSLAGTSISLNTLATFTVLAGLFILVEIGGFAKLRNVRSLGTLSLISGGVGILGIVVGIMMFSGLSMPSWVSQLASSLLAIFATVEAFKE